MTTFFLTSSYRWMTVTLGTNKNSFWEKNTASHQVIIQGSKAKGRSRSQRVCSHAQEDVQKLSDSWASTALIGWSASQFAYPLRPPSSPSPLSSLSRTIGWRGSKQADGGWKLDGWMVVKEQGQPCVPPLSLSLHISHLLVSFVAPLWLNLCASESTTPSFEESTKPSPTL
jgi:hypothetical protein